jgi:hypothetical protein
MTFNSLFSSEPGLSRVIAFEAASLVVMSTLHFVGILGIDSASGSSNGAASAEAVIALVLAAGAVALARRVAHGVAIGSVGFAIVGFLIGISFTISGGSTVDITYHATMLPLLAATLVALQRLGDAPRERRASSGAGAN